MPVIGIPVDRLKKMLRMDVEMDSLLEKLTQVGCDIEAVTPLFRTRCCECGNVEEFYTPDNPPTQCGFCNSDWVSDNENKNKNKNKNSVSLDPVEVIRMELLPVRPDMFDPGGLARMLRGFLGKEKGIPLYTSVEGEIIVTVDDCVNSEECFRPHIACAVIRNIQADEDFIRLIMTLQENLHWALGRNRKLASIGIYDLDAIHPDITYTSTPLDDLPFYPLGYPETLMTPKEILQKHPKGKKFAHLLENYKKVPLLLDSKGCVLSMPPIINSDATKVNQDTKNFFIDVTGLTDRGVKKTLNIVVTSILEYQPEAVLEQVRLRYSNMERISPDFSAEKMKIVPQKVNSLLGLALSPEEIGKHLLKMRYNVDVEGEELIVSVPPFRNDIMHERDIIEDIAISYGYKNFAPTMTSVFTIAEEKPARVAENNVCALMTGLGYLEVTTLLLTNEEKNFTFLSREPAEDRVIIENPISSEQTMLRTEIFPGLLEIFQQNIHHELPQKIFEVGDVVFYDHSSSYSTCEFLHLAFAVMDPDASFSMIKSEFESYMRETGCLCDFELSCHPFMIKNRQADILFRGEKIGFLGEIHPQTICNFHLNQPVSVVELNVKLVERLQ